MQLYLHSYMRGSYFLALWQFLVYIVIEKLLCKHHDIKRGLKLNGYYPYFGVYPFTFPSKYFASLQKRGVIFIKPFKMDEGEDSHGVSWF
jgi:hypothetical protein